MKYVTLLGVAVVAAAALTAFAGADTASAKGGVLCSTTTDPCSSTWAKETTLHFSSEESIKLSTTGGVTAATCSTATVRGKLTANADAEGTATGKNEVISWGTEATPCTKSSTTIALGALRIEQIAGTSNGTVIADSPIKVTMKGLFEGENCVYGFAAGTSIGTLTEGKPATFDASAVAKRFGEEDSCFFGPETTKWTGKYTLTEPKEKTLAVSASASVGVLCSTTSDPCTEKWAVPATPLFSSEESVKLQTTGGVTAATCSIATLETTLTANPDTEGTATSVNEIITWGTVVEPCTKSSTTIALGALRIEQIAGTSNGTVIADSPIKVTMKGLFEGENCVYGFAAGTSIGTLTEGKPATFDASAVAKKFGEEDSCFFGPETTKWTGKYTQTLPTNTTLSVSSS